MSKELEALKVWNAVEKYLNLYHHQAIKDDINVETVEGMPIKIIEKSLKALEIIKSKPWLVNDVIESKGNYDVYKSWCNTFRADMKYRANEEEFELLKEVLL